ncbi:hypothetical protein Barb7_02646 [Bacteroidales bacterium Barb7]|nr:hypothetical protein Barb7_02646 [Bacteroidales bacterium Barb7]
MPSPVSLGNRTCAKAEAAVKYKKQRNKNLIDMTCFFIWPSGRETEGQGSLTRHQDSLTKVSTFVTKGIREEE